MNPTSTNDFIQLLELCFCSLKSFQSLKKEIEWDRSDDKSIGESDYRHAHDSVSAIDHFFCNCIFTLIVIEIYLYSK